MCKELPVIPVNKVVDPKRIIGKKWRAEEERHKGSRTRKKSTSKFPTVKVSTKLPKMYNSFDPSCQGQYVGGWPTQVRLRPGQG
jgi:hypothetical protein